MQLKAAAQEALAPIRDWKPDLVYANDDVAQAEVTAQFLNARVRLGAEVLPRFACER